MERMGEDVRGRDHQRFGQLLVKQQPHDLRSRQAEGTTLALGGVREAGPDIIGRQLRKLGQQLSLHHAAGQIHEDITHRDARASDAGLAESDFRIHRDAIQWAHSPSLRHAAASEAMEMTTLTFRDLIPPQSDPGPRQVRVVHGLSTMRPRPSLPTQADWLPVGRRVASSLVAHGRPSSLPSVRHNRTVFTREQCASFNLPARVAKVRHVVEALVRVPLGVPVAPFQGPAANGRTVHELREHVLGVPGSILKVGTALEERYGVAPEPVFVCQLRPNLRRHALAERRHPTRARAGRRRPEESCEM